MDKKAIMDWLGRKGNELFNPENPVYQKRKKFLDQQNEFRKNLEKSSFHSTHALGDEVMGNMKTFLIIVIMLCSGLIGIALL